MSLRTFVEFLLPWYNPLRERQRDLTSARVRRRSETARLRAARAARALEEYRQAEPAAAGVDE